MDRSFPALGLVLKSVLCVRGDLSIVCTWVQVPGNAQAHVHGLRSVRRHLCIAGTAQVLCPLAPVVALDVANGIDLHGIVRQRWKAHVEAHARTEPQGMEPVGAVDGEDERLFCLKVHLYADHLVARSGNLDRW
jgi:hypothetical protein